MKKVLILLAFLCCNNIFAQEILINKLTESIKKEDSILFMQTLEYWSSNILCWTNDTLEENVLLKNINDVIAIVYSNNHSNIIMKSSSWWNNSLENDHSKKFVIFNGELFFVKYSNNSFDVDSMAYLKTLKKELNDSLGKSDYYQEMKWIYYLDSISVNRTDTIINIKPNLIFNGQKILLVNDTINAVLNKLFMNSKRKDFFCSKISVLSPFIDDITFDYEFQNCFVRYRWSDRGGYLILKKDNKGWEISESEIIWIQ